MDEPGTALADAIAAALPGWVERSVQERYVAWAATSTRELTEAAVAAGLQAKAEIGREVRALLAADVDDQRTTPLTLLRAAVRYPTEVLRRFGVPPVARDRFAVERFPDDLYDLTPATFADVDPDLAEPGLVWGAWKAMAHKQRHGPH